MLNLKVLAATALLACSLSAHAAPPAATAQPGIPQLLSSLGGIANPLLQPVLSITGPLVGGLVANATPQVFRLLGSVGSRPVNALLGTGGLVDGLPTLVPLRGGALSLPPLLGLK